MQGIHSVDSAKAAFPTLKWRDEMPAQGKIAFAIMGGDRATGDIIILLAMENGARAPMHWHHYRNNWPFRETITCLAGRMLDIKASDPHFVLEAGQSVDLDDDGTHAPSVDENAFALVLYRQPAGHTRFDPGLMGSGQGGGVGPG